MSLYDAKIAKIKEEIELLQDDTKEKTKNLEKMREELVLWEKQAASGDSYAKVQADKLKKQIEEIEKELKISDLQNQIAEIEKEKEKVEKDYELKLSDEFLYNEANQMILQGNMQQMVDLIREFDPDFGDIGLLFGKSLADGIKEGLQQGLDGLDYLKQNGYTVSGSERSVFSLNSDDGISTYSNIIPMNDFLPSFAQFSNVKGLGAKTENKTITVVNQIKVDGNRTNESLGKQIGKDITSVIFEEARQNGYNRTRTR